MDSLLWMYTIKVDKYDKIKDKKNKKVKLKNINKKWSKKYSEDFKKTIVTLYESGKTYSDIKKEYVVSSSAYLTG